MIEFEERVERRLIIPCSSTITEDIEHYRRAYAEYVDKDRDSHRLISVIEERVKDNIRYPYLNFFNLNSLVKSNCLKNFTRTLEAMDQTENNYPLTIYLLKRVKEWSDIPQLFPLMQFLNHIRDRFNYRIRRQEAIDTRISLCFNESHYKEGKDLFDKFVDAWKKIRLREVRSGFQQIPLDPHLISEKSLAFFALDASQDDSGSILVAKLQALGQLQNSLVNYFHQQVLQSNTDENEIRQLPLHKIREEHLFNFNQDELTKILFQYALVMNFAYGQSKELIYDYEEIELTLRSLVHRLPLIDVEHLPQIHYQGELYSEKSALINDVRRHVQQQRLTDDRPRQYRCELEQKEGSILLQYLASLDFVFIHMRSSRYRPSVSTIELFVEKYIRSTSFRDRNPLLERPYVLLELQYILDLYELVEEIAFDRIFRIYIKDKFSDTTMKSDQESRIQERFLRSIAGNSRLAQSLRDLSHWIPTLKRFMVRILQDDVILDSPIEMHLKRTGLWSSEFTEEEIDTIEIDESILVKHALLLLNGLERRLDGNKADRNEGEAARGDVQNDEKQQDAAKLFQSGSSRKSGRKPTQRRTP